MKTVATHVVLRPFDAMGKGLVAGDHVDASSWKNTEKLVNAKYLRPINPHESARGSQSVRAVDSPVPKRKFVLKKRG